MEDGMCGGRMKHETNNCLNSPRNPEPHSKLINYINNQLYNPYTLPCIPGRKGVFMCQYTTGQIYKENWTNLATRKNVTKRKCQQTGLRQNV